MALFGNQNGLSFAQDCFNIKANFLQRDRVQMENKIEDLKESLKVNKEMIQTLLMGSDGAQISKKFKEQTKILDDQLKRTEYERDEAQAKLLIAQQVRRDAERKQTDALRQKKECQNEFAQEKQLQEYRIQYLQNQYKKFEQILEEAGTKDTIISKKLKEAKFEAPYVRKIGNVVRQNEGLKLQLEQKCKEIVDLNKQLDHHVELLANTQLKYRADKFKLEEETKENRRSNGQPKATDISFTLAQQYCETSFNARKGRIQALSKNKVKKEGKPAKKPQVIPKLDLSQTRTGQNLDKKSLFAYIEKLQKMNKYHILRIKNLQNDNFALDRQNSKLKQKLKSLNETSVLNQTLNLSGIAPNPHQRSGTIHYERGGETLLIGQSAMTPRKRDFQQDLFGLVTYRAKPQKYSPLQAFQQSVPQYQRHQPFKFQQDQNRKSDDRSQDQMFSFLLGKTTINNQISGQFDVQDEEEDNDFAERQKQFNGSEYDKMDDQQYQQAVEERIQRGKDEMLQAKQQLIKALDENEPDDLDESMG